MFYFERRFLKNSHPFFLGILAFAVLCLFSSGNVGAAAQTCDFYASPSGSISGDGSSASPWNLSTALNQTVSIVQGKVVCLKGGIYSGKFSSRLISATVRSAPGEWAKIDGYWTTTLASGLSSTATNITVSSLSGFNYGSDSNVLVIEREHVYITNITGNTLTVIRGWSGTTPVAHTSGVLVQAGGNTLTVHGSDTVYRDFEVMNSEPNRIDPVGSDSQDGPTLRGEGIYVFGPRTKFINLVIHDNNDGMFLAESAAGAEVYGVVLYNNGRIDRVRGHGHGLYMQNADATNPKRIYNVISANNFATGMKAYGADQGNADGFDIQGVMSFNNGSPGNFQGNPPGYNSTHRFVGLEVGPENPNNPATNITIRNNYLYHMPGVVSEFGLARFGYLVRNNDIMIEDNYFAGGTVGVAIDRWNSMKFNRNTIYTGGAFQSDGGVLAVITPTTSGVGYEAGGNTYYDNRPVPQPYTFNITFDTQPTSNALGGGNLRFSEPVTGLGRGFKEWWASKGLAFDQDAIYVVGKPSGTKIFVRPNQYESGRAHIAVYNWDLSATDAIDLSQTGLLNGQSFKIVKAENYFGTPIYTGTYNSASPVISIVMNDTNVAAPLNLGYTPPSTCPEFCAFVVIPASISSPPPAPVINSFVASPASISPGQSAQLSWGANAAASLTLNPGAINVTTLGTYTVTPSSTAVYTLTAQNSGGTAIATTTVVVTAAPPPPPPPPPPGSSTKFFAGQRVQVSTLVNVRGTPDNIGTLLGTQAVSNQGAVIDGPINADGFNWWNVNYDTAPDGWSIEDYLVQAPVISPPPPPPPPTSGGGGSGGGGGVPPPAIPPPASGGGGGGGGSIPPPSSVGPLSVTFTLSVPNPQAPDLKKLIVQVGGSTQGTINYTFWWDCNNPGTNAQSLIRACGNPSLPARGVKYDNRTDSQLDVYHAYKAGAVAKVMVERGSAAAEARIAVLAPGASEPPSSVSIASSTPAAFLPPTAAFARTLKLGMRGLDVKALQAFLNAHGFPISTAGPGSAGKETDYFGPKMKAALIKFQRASGIVPASGLFGPLTRTKINSLR